MKLLTKVKITDRPGPTGILIETTPIRLKSTLDVYSGEEEIEFHDDSISITIKCRGQIGQTIAVMIEINNTKKEINETLKKNGISTFTNNYSLSKIFNLKA